MQASLTPDERWALLQLAEVATPAGRVLPPPSGETIDATLEIVRTGPALTLWRGMLRTLDLASIPLEAATLSALPLERRSGALERLARSDATGHLVRLVCAPLLVARAHDRSLQAWLGCSPAADPVCRVPADPRRVDLRSLPADEEIAADVVVIGTGAGGAPIAARLAERGHAVVMLEEGGDFGRAELARPVLETRDDLYRDAGLTFAVGDSLIPLPRGRSVGGTTTINSGTCFRTPPDVLRGWALEHGLTALARGALDEHFERVEAVLGVAPTPPELLGGVARVVARGADALGFRHGPLLRNAPGCDGQGRCCFGCPTDAKRSTNVSYVPMALRHGAQLFHHARAGRILREGRRVVGVEAFTSGPGEARPRRLAVRARVVVLACGAIETPLMLLDEGLALSSGQVGRNLSIHPASYAVARFDEEIRGWEGVPQGYGIDEHAALGIRFEGAFPPPALAAAALGVVGREWTENVEALAQLAFFGVMIRDTARGRVSRFGGRPHVRYRLADADLRTMVRAQAVLARVFFAAGAREVRPGLRWPDALRSEDDVLALERAAEGTVAARDLALSAYHPLGTCRMGADPSRSVVSIEQETHDVEGLFVCDGSVVPGPLGVNPQVTIMALSERAATFVERRIESRARSASHRRSRRRLSFDEVMAGALERTCDGGRIEVELRLRASTAADLGTRGASLDLRGVIDVFGLATARPCRGTLTLRPLARRETLVYDLSFEDDGGAPCVMRGAKDAWLFSLHGMTRLASEVRREGALYAEGTLRFDLRDVPAWLRSFRASA